jgi:glyoxylase-like metal-dependent hydrolase (beta-lactamase superfamily II)
VREVQAGLWHWQAPHPEWIERVGAVVAGDALVDFGRGFEVPREVLEHGVTREQVVEDLQPLLRLPGEVVLPAHGAPTDRAALERALSPDG